MNWYLKTLIASIHDELGDAEDINDLVRRFYEITPDGYMIKQEDNGSWAILAPDGQKLVYDEPPDHKDHGQAESLRRAILLALLRIKMTQKLKL